MGVSYGEDLEKARRVALEAVESLPSRIPSLPVAVQYEAFGDSSIDFQVRFWIEFRRQPDFLEARSAAIMAIKDAFDRNGITIPFPIRTLDFDGGAVGGMGLSRALREAR